MKKVAQVEGSSTLVRDLTTGAILNTDSSTIQQARAAKMLRKQRQQEIDELRDEVKEVKELLTKLIEKL